MNASYRFCRAVSVAASVSSFGDGIRATYEALCDEAQDKGPRSQV